MDKTPFKDILLVCDMDRTLLDSESRISIENISAIRKFIEKGGMFTIATGRTESTIRPYSADMPLNIPVILYNGAMIYDLETDKVIWQKYLEENVKPLVKWICSEFPEVGVEIFRGGEIYIVKENTETDEHVVRENMKPVYCGIDDVPFPWLKVIITWENEGLLRVKECLKPKETMFRTVFSEPQFLELLHSDVSKGGALEKLSGMLGFPRNRIISIGDNLNDVELIEFAGTGIAVDNAHPDLKKVADLCCCHHNDHAVAEVIGWIEEGRIG